MTVAGTMTSTESSPLLSPGKVAEALGISAVEALWLMLSGQIRTMPDAGVMMVPSDAIDEYRRDHAR